MSFCPKFKNLNKNYSELHCWHNSLHPRFHVCLFKQFCSVNRLFCISASAKFFYLVIFFWSYHLFTHWRLLSFDIIWMCPYHVNHLWTSTVLCPTIHGYSVNFGRPFCISLPWFHISKVPVLTAVSLYSNTFTLSLIHIWLSVANMWLQPWYGHKIQNVCLNLYLFQNT